MSPKPRIPLEDLPKLALAKPDFTSLENTTFSAEDIKDKVTYYFNLCIAENSLPTFTGLARTLGVSRHDLLSTYNPDPIIQSIINKSKQVIVEHVEKLLLSGRPPIGLIFWLKNNDFWIDKTEVVSNNKSMAEIMNDLEQNGTVINQSNPLNNDPSVLSNP